jgi:sugar phosphate isomerase/epimerase
MSNKLGANLTSYYAFELEPALEGVAAAGYRHVELTSIRGVVEHVPLAADAMEIDKTSQLLARHGLTAISLGGHSDLTSEGHSRR